MDARKQLGNLSLVACVMHLVASAFLWKPVYYPKFYVFTASLMAGPLCQTRETQGWSRMDPCKLVVVPAYGCLLCNTVSFKP